MAEVQIRTREMHEIAEKELRLTGNTKRIIPQDTNLENWDEMDT